MPISAKNFTKSDCCQPEILAHSVRAGLTLVELLVALLLSIMVIGVTFAIYQTNTRYYYRQQASLEQEQNLRTALYIMARDIRMAGDGLIMMGVREAQAFVPNPTGSGGHWFFYDVDFSGTQADSPGVRAIFGLDSDIGPDMLTIFRSEVESAISFGQLKTALTASSNKLELNESIAELAVEEDDVLGVVYGTGAVLLTAKEVSDPTEPGQIILGDRFKPQAAFPSGLIFPAGSYVYNLRDVMLTTYWVDTGNNNLMAKYHHLGNLNYDSVANNSVIVSPGIEDLQIRYVLNDQEPGEGFDGLTLGALDSNNWVRQIHLGLVSRSSYRLPGNNSYQPVSLFNHNPTTAPDGFVRQAMSKKVYLRNY
ncbi:MAG: PilW family protein [Deltaproteobacteria bacterium]|nr:PilW family protein [Deltaproteobacteria bacterium]